MSEIVNKISMQAYMEDFVPSLENFCSKSPLQPTIKVVSDTGDIKISSQHIKEELNYSVNPFKDKKSQIKDIKTMIESYYPVVFDRKSVLYSAEEIEQFIADGVTVKDALNMRRDVYLPRYKILRVHHIYNELDAYDFKTKKMIKFKLAIPLAKFLNDVFAREKEYVSSYFRANTKFMYVIRN